MTHLAAFIISYHRPEALHRHLSALLGQTAAPETILVVDNGSDAETRAVVDAFQGQGGPVRYLDAGENRGPAGAAALALATLVDEGYTWVVWGDDDDPPPAPTIVEELIGLPARHRCPECVGAVGMVGQRWDWKTGQAVRVPDGELRGVIEVDAVAGNQQLIVHRRAVEQVGLPARELFFGYEEPEYCLRMREAGLAVLVDGDAMLHQRELYLRLDLPRRIRRFSRAPDRSRLWRDYYSSRNYIYVMRNTFGRPDLARREVIRAVARSAGALGHGPRYSAAVFSVHLRAIRDGYRDNMGRTVEPAAKVQTR